MNPVTAQDKLTYSLQLDLANPGAGGTPAPLASTGAPGFNVVVFSQVFNTLTGTVSTGLPTLFQSDDAIPIATGLGTPQFIAIGSFPYLFNGTTYDRERSASAVTLDPDTPLVGAAVTATMPQWGGGDDPGDDTQAVFNRAAPGAGERHVVTSVAGSFSIDDGATGIRVTLTITADPNGTPVILFRQGMGFNGTPTEGTCFTFGVAGLNLVCPPDVDVEVAFDQGGGPGTFQTVSMSGYTVPA